MLDKEKLPFLTLH